MDELNRIRFLTRDHTGTNLTQGINEQLLTQLTVKSTVIPPNFLVWKFCGKAQFPHSFGQIARNYAESVPFHKISIPGN